MTEKLRFCHHCGYLGDIDNVTQVDDNIKYLFCCSSGPGKLYEKDKAMELKEQFDKDAEKVIANWKEQANKLANEIYNLDI